MRLRRIISKTIVNIALTFGAIIMFMPFLWMVMTAFKTPPELNVFPPTFLPKQFNADNFFAVFEAAPFDKYFWNSVRMAVISSVSIVFTSLLAGYIFAKFRMVGLMFIFIVFLATAIVPFEVYMIPLYLQMKDLNLLNTFTGMVLPYVVMSFGIFFMRQSIIQQIPDDLLEAARIEGASEWRIFFRIVTPLLVAPMSALGIFAFIEAWNAFVWA